MKSGRTFRGEVVSSRSVFGAPCRVSLTTCDLKAAEDFYRAVSGWECRPARLGEQFRTAQAHGVPVAGITAVVSVCRTAVARTPCFAVAVAVAVADADKAVARSQERGGTTTVGPIAFPPGRAALPADRDGAAFGMWEGEPVTGWETRRRAAPAFVRLHTRDAFDAAIFYGEVLEWASQRPGCREVHYDGDEVVLRSRGDVVARIHSGALGPAPEPALGPHWQIHFAVDDVHACVRAAREPTGAPCRTTARTAPRRSSKFRITPGQLPRAGDLDDRFWRVRVLRRA